MKIPLLFLNVDWKLPDPIRGFKGDKRDSGKRYLERRLPGLHSDAENFSSLFKKYRIDLRDKTAVDLAAGPGVDIAILSGFKPRKLIHLDKYKEVQEVAREFLEGHLGKDNIKNIEFITSDIMNITDIRDVDFIMCRGSTCLAGNDFLFFKHIKNCLKDGGYFWFSYLTYPHYRKNIEKSYDLKNRILNAIVYFIYLVSGLMIRTMIASSTQRIKKILNMLGFNILHYTAVEDGLFEVLIQKPFRP